MSGELLVLGVAIVTVLLGGGLGYAFAVFRFEEELQAAHEEALHFQQQLLTAPKRVPSILAQAPTPTAAEPTPAPLIKSPAADDLLREASETASDPAAAATTTQSWQQLIAETAAHAQSDVLCMVDIDYLRQHRETYGAELSDFVSQHIENIIRDTLQQHDAVISRYEGQELVIVWPASAGPTAQRLHEARSTAALLRTNVEQAFLQIGKERLTVTVSLGLALCEAGLPGEHVIARADEALAAAKKAGRNRGFFHNGAECLPVEPLTTPSTRKANPSPLTPNKSSRKGSPLERRRHERKPCSNINLIAPCTDNSLPSIEVFQRVQFFDISSSGFSMVLPTVPATSQFAVALINSKGMIFMAAEVANIRQSRRTNAGDKPLLIIGCRFRQRLYPHTTVEEMKTRSVSEEMKTRSVSEEMKTRSVSEEAPRIDEPLATVR